MGLLQSEFFEKFLTRNLLIFLDPRFRGNDETGGLQHAHYGSLAFEGMATSVNRLLLQ